MENNLISIIMPVYNTEDYVGRTIKNIQNQSYSNWELIAIDDGSTDNSGYILDQVSRADYRIKVIHTDNQGVSKARNIGIEHSKGKYIFFFDSDDIFSNLILEECISFAIDQCCDSVLYGYRNFSYHTKKHKFYLKRNIYIGVREICHDLLPAFAGISFEDVNQWILGNRSLREGKEDTAVWRIMCDGEIIRSIGLKFDENLSVGEDTLFLLNYLVKCNSVGILDKDLYFLVERPGSANWSNSYYTRLMIINKIKVAEAKDSFFCKLREETGVDAHVLYQGNNVLGAVQVLAKLAHDDSIDLLKKYRLAAWFCNHRIIHNSIKTFKPLIGAKALPFYLLKLNSSLLLTALLIIPNSIVNRFK